MAAEVERRQCTAKAKQTGKRCRHAPIPGGAVCHTHGGKAPQTRRAAARRLAEAKAAETLQREGIRPLTDPVAELEGLAAEVVALKNYLGARVEALESLRYRTGAGEQTRAELAAYERALDRCIRVLAEMARLGIAERRVRLAEAQVVMVGAAFERVLRALGHDVGSPAVRAVVQRELLALEAESDG